jgi:ADP-heptose:LPS heptosyltransferase
LLEAYINKVSHYFFGVIKGLSLPIRKNILIVKHDHIGDYLLVRNAIYNIHNYYKGYNIYLFCRTNVVEVAKSLDGDILKNIYSSDNLDLLNFKLLFLCIKIKLKSFFLVIHPTHSRTREIDFFIKQLEFKNTVCPKGDSLNYRSDQEYQNLLNQYTRYIEIPTGVIFELDKNNYFAHSVTGNRVNGRPMIETRKNTLDIINIGKPYIVFAIGASSRSRIWNSDRIIELIGFINHAKKETYSFVFLGLKDVSDLVNDVTRHLRKDLFLNLVGQTKFVDILNILKDATVVICNDTATFHLSASTSTNTVCVSNGNHYGRFSPYDRNRYPNVYCIYPWGTSDDTLNLDLVHAYSRNSYLDINSIGAERVFNKLLDWKLI